MSVLNVVSFKKRDWFLIVVILLIAALAYFADTEYGEEADLSDTPKSTVGTQDQ